MEGKVLAVPTDIEEYIKDLTKYLDGVTSPFANEGALGAYLIQGRPEEFFSTLAEKLTLTLHTHAAFVGRPHRISKHDRDESQLPHASSTYFVCNHLVFSL